MNEKRHKILIVKVGYSETLLPVIRQVCSFGDVFRTTVVLHLFRNDHVTWLTDQAALPLLQGNPYITRLLTFDLLSVLQLQAERFDKVINLEKVPGICSLVDKVNAWSKYGFRFDEETGMAEAYERAHEALAVATFEDAKQLNNKCWSEVLYEVLGAKWKGENYILGYKPKSHVAYDLGFNVHVGRMIPQKAWPMEHWKKLEKLVAGRYTFTYQQHLDDLVGYMDWIHSCRTLITGDTLGLYLGAAMGKKVLGLFGPTSATEQSPQENLRIIQSPAAPGSTAGFDTSPAPDDSSMRAISPENVFEAITAWV
jgi:heptosyltransferase-2